MLILFQILITLLSLLSIKTLCKRYKAKQLSNVTLGGWLLFWVLLIVVVFIPNIASKAAAFFGIGRGVDLVLYLSVALLFFILFKMQVKIELLSRQITQVVRDQAINKNK